MVRCTGSRWNCGDIVRRTIAKDESGQVEKIPDVEYCTSTDRGPPQLVRSIFEAKIPKVVDNYYGT